MADPKIIDQALIDQETVNLDREAIRMALGRTIREWRIKAQMTQVQLAEATGFDRKSICAIETGKQNGEFYTIYALCRGMNIKLDDFVDTLAANAERMRRNRPPGIARRIMRSPACDVHAAADPDDEGGWIKYSDYESILSVANAELEKYKTIMMATAVEIKAHWDAHCKAHWDAHCDADGYGLSSLLMRLEAVLHGEGYAYTAEDWIRCRARITELQSGHDVLRTALLALAEEWEKEYRNWHRPGAQDAGNTYAGACGIHAAELLALVDGP